MCCFLCQQLFFNFFSILFSLFQRRLLKLIGVLLICCCRVQQPWLIYTPARQKSTIFLKIFPKRHFDQYTQFSFAFLCILHTPICFRNKKELPHCDSSLIISYLLNNSIPTFTLRIVSSLPMISIISVAPAGVICFPDTAVLIGQSAYPFLQPLSATYFMSIS